MKFTLGKTKDELGDRPVEEETLRRWRAAAMRTNSARSGLTPEYDDWVQDERVEEESAPSFDESAPIAQQIEKLADPAPRGRTLQADPRLSLEQDLERRFGSRVKEAIGAGTVIEGKLSFDAPVRIDGTLHGEVVSSSTLIVGEQGSVVATLEVGSLVVMGHVQGNVIAKDLVEIRAGGRLDGDIRTKRIAIEDGGIFEGSCNKAL
ncbi:MAG: polymer-forming cytoskeletal protein [Bdellovibrionales bacterium]|nr:polymer-forming cytoskeletal protein [Bdellovibrionales bacterium]